MRPFNRKENTYEHEPPPFNWLRSDSLHYDPQFPSISENVTAKILHVFSDKLRPLEIRRYDHIENVRSFFNAQISELMQVGHKGRDSTSAALMREVRISGASRSAQRSHKKFASRPPLHALIK